MTVWDGFRVSEARPWEIAAAAVEFPVVVVKEGVDEPPRLSQWGGDPKRPTTSVTLEHGWGGMSVTTYPEPLWGEGEAWEGLEDLVEGSYGWGWEAKYGPPLNFEGLEAVQTTRTPTKNGYLEFTSYEPLSEEEDAECRSRRRQAASEAEHRVIELPLEDSLVQAQVVGGSDLWVAGFETLVRDAPLVALLSGAEIPPESLKLKLVDDLLTYLVRDYP